MAGSRDSDGENRVRLLRQRDQAVAALLLAVSLAGALVLANAGPERPEMGVVATAVRQHREAIVVHERVLQDVEAALYQNRSELKRLRAAAVP